METFFEDGSSEGFFNIPITRTIYPHFFYFLHPQTSVLTKVFTHLPPRDILCSFTFITQTKIKTHNGGCLGSHIDEERSKLRNVMRFAELVNHRIFERKWRSRVILRACLFECPLI